MYTAATPVSVHSASSGYYDKTRQRQSDQWATSGVNLSSVESGATGGLFFDDPKTGKPMPMGSSRHVPLPKLSFLKVSRNTSPTTPFDESIPRKTSFDGNPCSSTWVCRFCTYANVDFRNRSCALCGETTLLEHDADDVDTDSSRTTISTTTSNEFASTCSAHNQVASTQSIQTTSAHGSSKIGSFRQSSEDELASRTMPHLSEREMPHRSFSTDDDRLGTFQSIIPGPPELQRGSNSRGNPTEDICMYEPSVLARTSKRVFTFLRRGMCLVEPFSFSLFYRIVSLTNPVAFSPVVEKKFDRRKSNQW